MRSSHQEAAAAAGSASGGNVVPQSQPLQARSSNSGTSVKRSDNISQSSYPAGDVSSDKAFQGWGRASTSSHQQLAPGHLTTAFAAQKRAVDGLISSSTANTKETPTPATGKRVVNQRRIVNHHPTSDSISTSGAQPVQSTNQPSGQGRGVATRASGRSVRPSDQRAVKDSAIYQGVANAVSKPDQATTTYGASIERADALLKPVKQSNSEQGGTMRTTRSKAAKAKQHDKTHIGTHPPHHPPPQSESCAVSQVSNGQSEMLPGGNSEKIANVSINLMPAKRLELELGQPSCHQPAEDSKQQSPRSLSSTPLTNVCAEKLANQSFRINDSTDSLLENPLTTVIKQYQNMRVNAQQTGKNKPTIQQFLEKFEKEMQNLEDQYQAQQQAREEQMRLFQDRYGGIAPLDIQEKQGGRQTAYSGAHYPNDQPSPPFHATNPHNPQAGALPTNTVAIGHAALSSSAYQGDTIMVQDTSALGPMPHDNSNNSFISALHGPNQATGSVLGGCASSEITTTEVYETFAFGQNSLMAFYPRQVRKILTRRKTNNSANTILTELRDLKAPKHKVKVKKTMHKMQSLAMCQMNMMQILLQKISRRSKVIRKQEKIVNDNLKRKRIYLERDRFDLMSVLRKSLDVTDGQNANQTSTGVAATSTSTVAQKGKTRTTAASDLNSRCPSTAGTKSGADQQNTQSQSIKGSSTAVPPQFDEENTSMDGCQSRKRTRKLSGADNCESPMPEMVSHQISFGVAAAGKNAGVDNKLTRSPQPPSKNHPHGDDIMQKQQQRAAEEQVKQAVNLSEIDDSFLALSKSQQNVMLAAQASSQYVTMSQMAEEGASFSGHVPRFPHELQNNAKESGNFFTDESNNNNFAMATPEKGKIFGASVGGGVISSSRQQCETPMFDYEQHRLSVFEAQDDEINGEQDLLHAKVTGNQPRMGQSQSTQGRQHKHRSILAMDQPQAHQQDQRKGGRKLDMGEVSGSFAIADRVTLNLKAQDSKMSEGLVSGGTGGAAQSRLATNKKTAKRRNAKNTQSQYATQLKEAAQAQSQSANEFRQQSIIQQQQEEQDRSEAENAQNKLQEQKSGNQRKLSPLRNLGDDVNNQENTTNAHGLPPGHVQQQQPHLMPMAGQFVAPHLNVDEAPYYGEVGHHPGLALIEGDLDMQNDLIMMGHAEPHRQSIFNEFMKQNVVTATADDVANASGGHFQPLVTPAELAMHRSQSVLLPQHTQNLFVEADNPHAALLDPIVANNLAGAPPMQHGFGVDQFAQAVPVVTNEVVDAGGHPKQPTSYVGNFFDESAQELSSIDHTANAVDNYGFHTQNQATGPNPYEQAKRQYLKKSMLAQQVANPSHQQSVDQQHNVVNAMDHLKVPQFEHVNNFVSPISLQQLSSQNTPQKQMEHDGQPGPIMVDDGTSTPSHFMSGVEGAAVVQASLGRGKAVVPPHSLQHHQHHAIDHHQRQQESHHQLSVSRICGNRNNVFMSGNSGFQHHDRHHHDSSDVVHSSVSGHHHHPGHHQHLRGNFGNTPAGLLSHGQQSIGQQSLADNHRQYQSVSGWNLDEQAINSQNTGAANHLQQKEQGGGSNDGMYHGLPDSYI